MAHGVVARAARLAIGAALVAASVARGDPPTSSGAPPAVGRVEFRPDADEARVPEPFRLDAATFDFRAAPLETVCTRIGIHEVTFPSPVVTESEANNTVHAEYFYPRESGAARRPAVIVLHILGGDFDLSRLFCRSLAHQGVTAMFVKMPYYGPRRDPALPQRRMVSADPEETVAGMVQAIKDIRRARSWLAARDEVDPARTGVFGVSLGGITAALAFSCEPRFDRACLMLAGGDIGQVGWRSPELAPIRERWKSRGGDEATFVGLWKSVDPVTYADRIGQRPVLMLNSLNDEVIPRECTDSLWRSFNKPPIVWYDAGHYSVARFMFDGVARTVRFFSPE